MKQSIDLSRRNQHAGRYGRHRWVLGLVGRKAKGRHHENANSLFSSSLRISAPVDACHGCEVTKSELQPCKVPTQYQNICWS